MLSESNLRKKVFISLAGAAFCMILLAASFAHAGWSDQFYLSGLNGKVNAIAKGSGNDVYVGGYFTIAEKNIVNYIAKWDGTSWSALGSGMDNVVYALKYDAASNTLYAGGHFTRAGGSAANYIAKWNGTSWSALGSGMDNAVKVIEYDSASNILYTGGYFTTAGGYAANYIAKWDGTSWSPLGAGMDASVSALAYDSATNTLYAGGYFTTAGGSAASNIAKWNGTSWSPLGAGMDVSVSALVYDSVSNTLYAGGDFWTADGNTAKYMAKWNGTSWSPLGAGIYGPVNGNVNTLAYDSASNTLYAGGKFTTADGSAASNIAKWDGTSWSPLGAGMSSDVYALAYDAVSNTLYAGGLFNKAGDSNAGYFAKWNNGTWSSPVTAAGNGISGTVYTYVYDSAGNLYVGGKFSIAGGIAANNIAKWNGTSWIALGAGMNGDVNALAYDSASNTLYAGGKFTTADDKLVYRIAKWDGTSWSILGSGISGGYSVNALAYDSASNTLYAGGSFWTAGGISVSNIAKWNGTSWIPLDSGLDLNVYTLAYDSVTNTLYVGGNFSKAGGITANRVAKWNGTSWVPLGSGMNANVNALVYDSATNTLYAGASGSPTNKIAKWDGTAWIALGAGITDFVYALAYDSASNTLYAGGKFSTAGGITANKIAKWDGTSWSALGSGVNNYVYALAYNSASDTLYAGGNFTMVDNTIFSNGIGLWTPPPKISSVSSPAADGTYGTGSVIPITVTFSKPVSVTGIPQLTLETGTTDAVVDYSSGSGTSVLAFNYTVAAGHTAADLDYISTAALSLNSGTVKNPAGTDNAVLTLPAPGAAKSLGADKAIVIDGTAPAITSVTSSAADGRYYPGDTIDVTVNFSENVTLSGGNLTVNLDSGGSVTIAPFGPAASASGTYTAAAGQSSADLDSVSVSPAGGAALKDAAGNDAVLTIPPGQSLKDSRAIVISPVPSPPAAPTGLNASAVSQTQISLSWTDNSSNETGFGIFRNGSLIATAAVNAVSYSDSGLTCSTAYSYEVRATNPGGDSAGVTATASTSACPPTAEVSMVGVSDVKAYTAVVGATASGTGITERGFYWWNTGESSGLIPEGGSGAGAFGMTLTGLKPLTTYNVAAYAKIGSLRFDSGSIVFTTDASVPDACTGGIPGDLNGDGNVDLTDVIIALQILDGVAVSNPNLKADVNGDCKIGLEEAIFVLQKAGMLR